MMSVIGFHQIGGSKNLKSKGWRGDSLDKVLALGAHKSPIQSPEPLPSKAGTVARMLIALVQVETG